MLVTPWALVATLIGVYIVAAGIMVATLHVADLVIRTVRRHHR